MNILLQRARRLFNANNGFILPTVLIVSVIMMSALMMSLSVVWSSRQSLKNQFDLQNARNASISGINVADGCRYGDILISDTVSASSSPLGTADCGITNSSASTNFLILKQTYGNAASSFGFKATYLKNSNDIPVAITSTSGVKGGSANSYIKQNTPTDQSQKIGALPLQRINKFNCPSDSLTRAYDARDNRSYWVKTMADGKCWMLSNLAYGGGGVNTYGDVRTLTDGSSNTSGTATLPKYYNNVDDKGTFTEEPKNPSTSTNGYGQLGYLYNFCAANGGQTGNGACSESSSTAVNTGISVCPAGWRLPITGSTGGEFKALNDSINGGSLTSHEKLLSVGLFKHRGAWYKIPAGTWEFSGWGIGYYWSSTQKSVTDGASFKIMPNDIDVNYMYGKMGAFSVRCVVI